MRIDTFSVAHPGLPQRACVLLIAVLLSGCNDQKSPAADDVATVGMATPPAPVKPTAMSPSEKTGAGPIGPVELSLAERQVALTPAKTCNIERIDGKKFSSAPIDVRKSSAVTTLTGWVADVDQHSVPTSADLRFFLGSDKPHVWKVTIQPNVKRNDVVKSLGGDNAFTNSGFSVIVDVRELPLGDYRVFMVFGDRGALKVCDNGRVISVKD